MVESGDILTPASFGQSTSFYRWFEQPWIFRCAIAAIGIIYLSSLTPRWYPSSDSALYLMLGDNLADGAGYTLWGKPHVHVPPGFPLLLAGLKLIGIESHFELNLVMMLIAWATLTCCYFALREFVTPGFAKALICLVAVCHVMHHTSVCLLSDIPFMGLVWLGLWCQLYGLRTGSRSLEAGSLLLLASCTVRVVGLPIAVGAAAGLLLQSGIVSRKRRWANAGTTVLLMLLTMGVGAAYVLDSSKHASLPSYLAEFSRYFDRLSRPGVTQPFMNFLYTGPELSILLTGQKNQAVGLFIALLWIPVVLGAIVCWQRGQHYGVCILASYLLALLLMRPLIARYLLPMAPLLFWYAIEGLRWLGDFSLREKSRGLRIATTCALLLLALNLPKTGKLAYRLHYPKTNSAFNEQRDIADVALFLRRKAKPGERFITNEDERQLAYLSGLWTVPLAERKLDYTVPSPDLLDEILSPGVDLVVLRNCGNRRHYRLFYRQITAYPGIVRVHANEQFDVFRLLRSTSHQARLNKCLTTHSK